MPITADDTTHDKLERSLADVDLQAYVRERRTANPVQPYVPSPPEWQDQLLYFLMLDRFSDGDERGTFSEGGSLRDAYHDNDGNRVATGATELFRFPEDAYKADRASWADAGGRFCGGTLRGLKSKLGYLRRMGVTALWISPVFKQVESTFDPKSGQLVPTNSYHGYGVQNFLDVDPHFGTRRDLKELVAEAHRLNIYVILDIILNHSGDVFQYAADRYNFDTSGKPLGIGANGDPIMDPRWDGGPYEAFRYRNAFGAATIPFGTVDQQAFPHAWPNDAVWPAELQVPATFTRRGRITDFDNSPEYLEGDFFSLKDINHGQSRPPDPEMGGCSDYASVPEDAARRYHDAGEFRYTPALASLAQCFKFWIAYADVDGFRIDTVKHMELGASRYFVSVIHEFAQSIGKENFLLMGEITGGRVQQFETLDLTGLDAALSVGDIEDKMEFLAKGFRDPLAYFCLFRNSEVIGKASHTWFGRHIITMFDDHDRVGRSHTRFAGDKVNQGYRFLVPAIALNLFSMGIPCLYYGTEQAFDGSGDNDRFLRECMFGGPFGSLQSTGRHFFNENHPVYKAIADFCALRQRPDLIALRRGRQFLRDISGTGNPGEFGPPHMVGNQIRSVIAWSRIFSDQEILVAVNTDADNSRTAWVRVDSTIHRPGESVTCLYSTEPSMVGKTLGIENRGGSAVEITVPPAGFVAYA